MADLSPAAAAALLVLQHEVEATSDPLEIGGYMAAIGSWLLSRIGFEVTGPADVRVDIGTDEHPGEARIVLAWPLPAVVDGAAVARG
jgi:hypothetical protein